MKQCDKKHRDNPFERFIFLIIQKMMGTVIPNKAKFHIQWFPLAMVPPSAVLVI